jgi:hypothetical protein
LFGDRLQNPNTTAVRINYLRKVRDTQKKLGGKERRGAEKMKKREREGRKRDE